MSALQISAPTSLRSPASTRHAGPVLRVLHAVIAAMGETNRRRAEREIARMARSYGIVAAQLRD
ncbi:hypothetical protein [Microvirga calopogonii]|uniref:hypothetical protein n=1 Tax=Microvirga calopogonii TaxID=2078013 RepID=UPI0013B369C7|nr:hypothetical protein [Microvirga calopogonii]